MKETVVWNIEEGRKLTGPQLGQAEIKRTLLYHRVCEFMERYEFLLLPVSQVPPFDVTQPYVTEIAGVALETYIDWMKSCLLYLGDGPTRHLGSCGFTPKACRGGTDRGASSDDFGVLQLAHAFEQATGFWKRRPAIA
jgi:amidase